MIKPSDYFAVTGMHDGILHPRRASIVRHPPDGPGTHTNRYPDRPRPGVALAGVWREFPVLLHDVATTAMLAWFDLEACAIRIETCDTPQHGRIIVKARVRTGETCHDD